jgi:hypothetical protein
VKCWLPLQRCLLAERLIKRPRALVTAVNTTAACAAVADQHAPTLRAVQPLAQAVQVKAEALVAAVALNFIAL